MKPYFMTPGSLPEKFKPQLFQLFDNEPVVMIGKAAHYTPTTRG